MSPTDILCFILEIPSHLQQKQVPPGPAAHLVSYLVLMGLCYFIFLFLSQVYFSYGKIFPFEIYRPINFNKYEQSCNNHHIKI